MADKKPFHEAILGILKGDDCWDGTLDNLDGAFVAVCHVIMATKIPTSDHVRTIEIELRNCLCDILQKMRREGIDSEGANDDWECFVNVLIMVYGNALFHLHEQLRDAEAQAQ